MEKLISKNFLGEEMVFYGCKSCAISNHEITNLIGGYIYDDGFVNITADPEVPIKGFMIVGIKPHLSKLTKLIPEQRMQLFEVINKLEFCLSELGENSVIKFEDGYSSHWREWIIPATYDYYYNPQIYEDDEKSQLKCQEYYEKFCYLILKTLLNENITSKQLIIIKNAINKNYSIEKMLNLIRNIFGNESKEILSKIKEYNMNFGRGKNLKNITNYAKMNTTDKEKEKVVEFARKVKAKFNELY